MAGVLAHPDLFRFIGGGPPTVADLEAQYVSWVAGPQRDGEAWLNWVLRDRADVAVGHAQATVTNDGSIADIAWLVGVAWQGRGYATEAAQAIVAWLRDHRVVTVTAHIHRDHLASARVAERAGFVRTDDEQGGETVWQQSLRAAEN